MDGSQNDDRRSRKRVSAEAEIICRIPAIPKRVKLLDVSASGCRLKVSGMRVEPGATVHIDLPDGGCVSGIAIWYEASKLGVRFYTELDDNQAVALGLMSAEAKVATAHFEQLDEQPRKAHWLRRSRKVA